MAFVFVESGANFNACSVFVKALKLLLFSAGLISTLVMVKGALMPLFYEIIFPNLVACWNSFRYFWSSPLYICIIINSVVLLIAATSTLHHDDDDNQDPPSPRWVEAPPPPPPPPPETTTILLVSTTDDDDDQKCSSSTSTLYGGGGSVVNTDNSSITQTSSSTSLSPQLQLQLEDDDDDEGLDDMIKMAPADHSLSRDERENETIESTWKTIVEAGGKTKKLTKSESVPPRTATATWKELRKLETFNDVGASMTRRRLLMRRDPSIGVEEFNQKVEAFINKFNQDMRLQRQESDQRFLDMINRGL